MLRHGRNAAIYMDGVDLSGDLNAVNPNSVQELAEVTTFGHVGHTSYPGLAKDTGTIEALYNSTERAVFEGLVQQATGVSMLILFGTAAGDPAYGLEEVMLKSNSIKSVVSDVNRVSFSFDTDNHPFENCILLAPKTSVIATGTATTNIDAVASSALGGAGYAQIFGVSTGTLTLAIQTSSTGAFAGEQATTCAFAAASSSEAQRVAISGTIERYSRAAWTVTGSTCTFAVALKRY